MQEETSHEHCQTMAWEVGRLFICMSNSLLKLLGSSYSSELQTPLAEQHSVSHFSDLVYPMYLASYGPGYSWIMEHGCGDSITCSFSTAGPTQSRQMLWTLLPWYLVMSEQLGQLVAHSATILILRYMTGQ